MCAGWSFLWALKANGKPPDFHSGASGFDSRQRYMTTIKEEITMLNLEYREALNLKVSALESEVRRNTADRFSKAMRYIQAFPHIQLLIKEGKKIDAIRDLRIAFMESTEMHLDLYIAKKSVELWASLFN